MPLVSVIIPTYNRVEMVQRAVQSVLAQTFTDYEIIVVDDASEDDTAEVMKGLPVRYFRLDKNTGSSCKPRNKGILEARGEYIALLDSDDEWYHDYLEKVVAKMDSSPDNVGMVYCQILLSGGNDDGKIYPDKPLGGKLWPFILSSCLCSTTSTIIKKSCFATAGLFDTNNCGCHWEMWIRLGRDYEFDYVDEVLAVHHLQHNTRESNKPQIDRLSRTLAKHKEEYAKYPAAKREAMYNIAHFWKEDGHKLTAIKMALPHLILIMGIKRRKWTHVFWFIIDIFSPKLANLWVKFVIKAVSGIIKPALKRGLKPILALAVLFLRLYKLNKHRTID